MKTAKEILDGKIYNRFDLARDCEDVALFRRIGSEFQVNNQRKTI